MEEDAVDRGIAYGEQMTMRSQIAVNNINVPNNFVTPTTDMEMIIRVEALQTVEEFKRCYPLQDGHEPMRKDELDHLQPSRLLRMQFITESN
eukprot:16080926-Heterocapsa_arctica.AAC.1